MFIIYIKYISKQDKRWISYIYEYIINRSLIQIIFNTGYHCKYSLILNLPYWMTDKTVWVDTFSGIRLLPETKTTNNKYNSNNKFI